MMCIYTSVDTRFHSSDNKMMLHEPKQSLAGLILDYSYVINNLCFFVTIKKQGLSQRGIGLSLVN